jgi:hypothetical protein
LQEKKRLKKLKMVTENLPQYTDAAKKKKKSINIRKKYL